MGAIRMDAFEGTFKPTVHGLQHNVNNWRKIASRAHTIQEKEYAEEKARIITGKIDEVYESGQVYEG